MPTANESLAEGTDSSPSTYLSISCRLTNLDSTNSCLEYGWDLARSYYQTMWNECT